MIPKETAKKIHEFFEKTYPSRFTLNMKKTKCKKGRFYDLNKTLELIKNYNIVIEDFEKLKYDTGVQITLRRDILINKYITELLRLKVPVDLLPSKGDLKSND